MRMDEHELIGKVQEGDEMAFTKIVNIYQHKIVNFLWQLTGDYQKSVELAQETFMRVYFKANKYKPIAPLSSWIYTIASNLAKTEMKKTRRFPSVSFEKAENNINTKFAYTRNQKNLDLIKDLREAINSLHPRYKIPVILKDIEGFSQEEIAQILNKPIGTIKARISRGRNCIKKGLEEKSDKINIFKNGEKANGRI